MDDLHCTSLVVKGIGVDTKEQILGILFNLTERQ